ncbi:MAG: TIGR04086 family membrane protein [Lachnospirales bacterium]
MNKVYTRKNTKQMKEGSEKNLSYYMLKAVIKGIMITLVGFFVLAYLLTYSDFNESMINPVVIIISVLSCFVLGFDFSKANKEKGLIFGAIGGLIYFLIYILCALAIPQEFSFDTRIFFICIFSVLASCLGGILGVNKR